MTETQPAPMGGNGEIRTYSRIAAALAKLQPELPVIARDQKATVVGKDKEGNRTSYSYSFTDLAGIARQVYPLLGQHGLSFTSGPTMTGQGRFVLRWMLLHESGEYIDGDYPLPGDVKSPQALGSAITYGRRYCLCSAVGVVTDDDDGAAAEHAARDQAAAPMDPERADAVNRVAAAWNAQYGSVNWAELGAEYTRWSNGKRSQDASPAELRKFAAYLSALPAQDAGSDPTEDAPPPQDGPAEDSGRRMTPKQQGMLFAGWAELGVTERQAQLQWVRDVTGVDLSSRSGITFDMAKRLLDEMTQRGVTVQ